MQAQRAGAPAPYGTIGHPRPLRGPREAHARISKSGSQRARAPQNHPIRAIEGLNELNQTGICRPHHRPPLRVQVLHTTAFNAQAPPVHSAPPSAGDSDRQRPHAAPTTKGKI